MIHPIFDEFTRSVPFTDDLKNNVYSFLSSNNCPTTAKHSIKVGTEARRIVQLFHADTDAAEIAGWLHDISAVIPNSDRIAVA
jgi:HD superfamily phosphodiesterase